MTKISFAATVGLMTMALICTVNTARGTPLGNPQTANNASCPGNCVACSPAEMHCSGANVTDVLNNGMDFLQVVYLDFSNTSLQSIPTELKYMSNCKTLDLSANNIQTIDKFALENLWSLEELILSNNSIADIALINPNTLFYNNKNIKVLNLSNNPFADLGRDPNTMLYSESLEVLDVSKCRIVSLVGQLVLDGLKMLTYLNLSNNPLTRLDALFSVTLKILNVKGCLLGRLGEGALSGFGNLEILDASLNDQLYIDSSLRSPTLESLDVSFCSVRTPNLLGMTELRSAFLNNNRIRKLAAYQFANNTKLVTLDLSKNNVETVDPLAFYGMSSLLLLDLSSNGITTTSWETSMIALPSLQMLNLSYNPIGQIGILKSNTIRRLDLSHCQIHSIPNEAFAQLDQLAELVLSNNPLQVLFPGSFNSTRLSLLDLSYCRISHLTSYDFANSPNLTDVRLTGNRLVTLKNGTFAKCAKLKYVYLDDNPWRCDCYSVDFAYMSSLTNRTKVQPTIDSSPRCSSPENVTGMAWHAACVNGLPYGRDNRKNFSMAVGVILILCVSGLMAICVAVHENMKSQQAMRRRQQLDEYDGSSERGGLNANDEYFDVAESVRKLSQLPSYDEAITLPKPPGKNRRTKRHSCTQTDEADVAATVADRSPPPPPTPDDEDDEDDDDDDEDEDEDDEDEDENDEDDDDRHDDRDDDRGDNRGDDRDGFKVTADGCNVVADGHGKYNRFLMPPGFHVTQL